MSYPSGDVNGKSAELLFPNPVYIMRDSNNVGDSYRNSSSVFKVQRSLRNLVLEIVVCCVSYVALQFPPLSFLFFVRKASFFFSRIITKSSTPCCAVCLTC